MTSEPDEVTPEETTGTRVRGTVEEIVRDDEGRIIGWNVRFDPPLTDPAE